MFCLPGRRLMLDRLRELHEIQRDGAAVAPAEGLGADAGWPVPPHAAAMRMVASDRPTARRIA